jgi:hypothetical protein
VRRDCGLQRSKMISGRMNIQTINLPHIKVYRFAYRFMLVHGARGVVKYLVIDGALNKLGGTDHDAERFYQPRKIREVQSVLLVGLFARRDGNETSERNSEVPKIRKPVFCSNDSDGNFAGARRATVRPVEI